MKVKSLTESLEKLIENKYVEKEPSNILEATDNILGKLNEAEMSPEDARDTELLKSARHKIAGKKVNAKTLTPEEQEVLAKYGLDAWGYKGETKMVTPGKTELFHGQPGHGWGRTNSDSFSEPKDSWNGRSVRSSRGGNYDKANFADRARKLDARAENQPYRDLTAARHTDEVSMRSKYGVDKIRRAKDSADYHADAIRNLDKAEAESKAQAQQKYDNTMERIADQEERQQAVKQRAQDRIDAILAKHRKEVVESLQHFLRTLNEATMSDEDRRDSEIIRDITYRLMKRRNAKLSDEEKALLDKYGITNTSGVLRTAGGKVMPRPDHNLRPGESSELVSRAHQGDNLDKVNLADYARKADEREAKRTEMAAPYWDEYVATKHDEKNIDARYGGGSTQHQRRVKQTVDMVRDYDDMASALDDRKFADRNIKQLQKDRGDALEQKRSDEKRAESRTVSNREYHTDRLKKYTAEKDRLIADKKAQFSKKNESLNEAAGNVRIVETGLSGAFGKEIIDSIIGQMSDGIWENTPYMEYYWPNVDATDNGDIEVSTDWTSKWNQKENKFRNMSDQEVRKFFANKLKAIAQEYLNDNNMNPYTEFRADNEEVCSYLGGHVVEDITIGQAYEAYNILRK